eukprot:5555050-Amphidinium_carterae.1
MPIYLSRSAQRLTSLNNQDSYEDADMLDLLMELGSEPVRETSESHDSKGMSPNQHQRKMGSRMIGQGSSSQTPRELASDFATYRTDTPRSSSSQVPGGVGGSGVVRELRQSVQEQTSDVDRMTIFERTLVIEQTGILSEEEVCQQRLRQRLAQLEEEMDGRMRNEFQEDQTYLSLQYEAKWRNVENLAEIRIHFSNA